ncbi:hypothetical protein A3715_11065 [Oleiphilus sp. HI0009]|uniref:hypothetical protein n=1 Tax=unclassified Oleiphilus TaxID=2631174 RepID=UPI0007C2D1D8|nr:MULTISPECIES: hypothetical protein [unclassified Oleiphilus]KZX77753.1 hypothetical protein A3715_11065 [Oleiphilus sp. HI0009]KZY66464.1 hypothetical protein A3738_06300 [Oleiphilus sp. HI0066]KZY68980.1 hypothetical protein A3739_09915 [Oleiphilus sp. HI0067]
MQIRQIIHTAAAIALSAMTLNVQALEKGQALGAMEKVYEATINSYYSINGFYNFSANQADKEQQQEVQFAVGSVEDLMIDIAGALSDSDLISQVDAARDAWLTYEDSLNENIEVVNDTGYTDLRLVGELANYNISFNDALNILYKSIAEQTASDDVSKENESHNAAKMVALMMTKYSARSTSTVSQVYSREDESDITLDVLAKDFDGTLNGLLSEQGNPEAAKLLDSAKTKWEFIQPSLVNYNENRVNFIVNLYSKKIIENLQLASKI